MVVYRLQGVEFEWDDQKARENIEKHGITFEEAVEVFFDPFYTERRERTQIISARLATRAERKHYESA